MLGFNRISIFESALGVGGHCGCPGVGGRPTGVHQVEGDILSTDTPPFTLGSEQCWELSIRKCWLLRALSYMQRGHKGRIYEHALF